VGDELGDWRGRPWRWVYRDGPARWFEGRGAAYLRALESSNGDDRRDVIASVFAGVSNRMESGYLLDVINKVNGIHLSINYEKKGAG
jgi:hypothetical protein